MVPEGLSRACRYRKTAAQFCGIMSQMESARVVHVQAREAQRLLSALKVSSALREPLRGQVH
jgi:hypothetical protein